MSPITLIGSASWVLSPAQTKYLVSLEVDLLENYIIVQDPPVPKEKSIKITKHKPMPFWANDWRKK